MTTCPRAWEVEAARDGRLTGKARETLSAHVAICASCARDAEALEGLARGLRALGGPDRDDVSIRRLRNRVLEAVDAEQTGRVRLDQGNGRRPARFAAFAVALAAMVVLAFVAFGSLRGHGPRAEVAQARGPEVVTAPAAVPTSPVAAEIEATRVDVSAGAGARYTRTTEATVERFQLVEGTLRLHVQRAPGGRRVVVVVPDGEIEDVGTTFEVVVAGRHTEQVSVDEGRVVVRLTDRAPLTLEAGKAWRRVVVARAKERPNGGPKASAAAPALGENEREDAAYLDVLRLLREGHDGDARAAASRYLHDFPSGFRRAEMERVAAGQRAR